MYLRLDLDINKYRNCSQLKYVILFAIIQGVVALNLSSRFIGTRQSCYKLTVELI